MSPDIIASGAKCRHQRVVPSALRDQVRHREEEQVGPAGRPARPAFVGMGRSGHSDTSARADEILRETGFGE
ncbi:hypothetical protein C1I97_18440 [Streptomyces sp. NTH33]|nr:hypothetical protein C1I97_18440 [Streptomyces sp. NTH33]